MWRNQPDPYRCSRDSTTARTSRSTDSGGCPMSPPDWRWELAHDRHLATGTTGLTSAWNAFFGSAPGDVLEVGARAGANLSHYGPRVRSLTMTEWQRPLFDRLALVAQGRNQTVALRAPTEDLPFNDATFDQVVSTFTLCRADDQPRALREIRRVLRSGGTLLFVEHVRAADHRLAARQDRMNTLHRRLLGCECNRPTIQTIRTAGFDVTELQHTVSHRRFAMACPRVIGTARPSVDPHDASPSPTMAQLDG